MPGYIQRKFVLFLLVFPSQYCQHICMQTLKIYIGLGLGLLNIEALSYGTELLLGVLPGYQSKKISYYFPIFGARIPIY